MVLAASSALVLVGTASCTANPPASTSGIRIVTSTQAQPSVLEALTVVTLEVDDWGCLMGDADGEIVTLAWRACSPPGREQVLHDEREPGLRWQPGAPPALRQQRGSEQYPGHERQPDALDLGAAHLRDVGEQAHREPRERKPRDRATGALAVVVEIEHRRDAQRAEPGAPRRPRDAGDRRADRGADPGPRADRHSREIAPHPVAGGGRRLATPSQ